MFHKEILVWKGNVSSLTACFYFLLFVFYYQVKISLPLSLLFFPRFGCPPQTSKNCFSMQGRKKRLRVKPDIQESMCRKCSKLCRRESFKCLKVSMMQPHGDIVLNIGHVSLTLFKKSIEPSTVFCPIPNGWKLCSLQNYLGRMPNWAIENASAEALVPISNTGKENSKILFKKECSMTFKFTLFKNTKFVNIQC